MEKLFFSNQNIGFVKKNIYQLIFQKYNYNANGIYDSDIINVLTQLWERNKHKGERAEKSKNGPQKFIMAINEKAIEIIVPQIENSIKAGTQSMSNNDIFTPQESKNPKAINQDVGNNFENVDTEKEYEKLLKERGYQGNIYSSSNYQQLPETYDNHLPAPPPQGNNLRAQGNNGVPIGNNAPAPYLPESEELVKKNVEKYIKENPVVLPKQKVNSEPATYNNGFSYETHTSELIGSELKTREKEMLENYDNSVMIENVKEEFKNKPKDTTNRVDDVFNKNKKYQPSKSSKDNYEEELRRQTQNPIIQAVSAEPPLRNDTGKEAEEKTKLLEQYDLDNINKMTDNAYINYNLIPPEVKNYMRRPYFFVVDSLQRDFITFPTAADFEVKFEQPDEVVEIPQRLLPNGAIQYGPAIVYEYAGGKGAKLENILKNLLTLRVIDCQVPYDAIYVGGKNPYLFNGPRIDENKVISPYQFPSYPYGPIYQDDYGIPIDVLDEPYYFLVVPQIDGAYDGTTLASRRALAKLSYDKLYGGGKKFINLKPTDKEFKYWHPTQLGSLNTMNLLFVNRFNTLVNLGQDRIIVDKIEMGEENDGKYCNIKVGDHLTKITIRADDPSYFDTVCSQGNFPGDKLIFYSCFSCDPQYSPNVLPDVIKINLDSYPICKLVIENDSMMADIDVLRFMKEGDLLVLNNVNILEVVKLNINSETYQAFSFIANAITTGFDPTEKYKKIAYVKKNIRGYQTNNNKQINYIGGVRVAGAQSSQFTFQLIYSYECLPNYLKSAPEGFFKPGDAFYLQAKKQITYTFEAVSIEQNANPLISRIIT